jgi:hypothetical protein
MANGKMNPGRSCLSRRRFRRTLGLIALAQALFLLSLPRPRAIAGGGHAVASTHDIVPGSGSVKDWPRHAAVAASDINMSAMPTAVMGDTVMVQAAGRGLPWINLTDGREVVAAHTGPADLCQALENNQAAPLALASADLDEDGVPDLVCGYRGEKGGVLTIQRGNIDSIYPNMPEAKARRARGSYTDAPFLSPVQVLAAPAIPDFIETGDFNADGHLDIAVASRGGRAVYILEGDGAGGLARTETIDLPGKLTALVAGDVNRQDGLADLIAAVDGAAGPRVIVFEGATGALSATPETFALPARAASVAIGDLDGDLYTDIAVGAGNELVVIHGRDRQSYLGGPLQTPVPDALISTYSFPAPIQSVAAGRFTGSRISEVAVLLGSGAITLVGDGGPKRTIASDAPRVNAKRGRLVAGRVSGLASEDLVMIDSGAHKLQIWMDGDQRSARELRAGPTTGDAGPVALEVSGEPVAALPMRLNADGLSDFVLLITGRTAPSILLTQTTSQICVTEGMDIGPGTLFAAINQANNTPGLSIIVIVVPFIIVPPQGFPAITATVVIDGTETGQIPCAPLGADKGPFAQIQQQGTKIAVALDIESTGSVIEGLAFSGFVTPILINGGTFNRIEGCIIGADPSIGLQGSNSGVGVAIESGQGNVIGGTAGPASNVISNNGGGVMVSGSSFDVGTGSSFNQIAGNSIGSDGTGTLLVGNRGAGVTLSDGASHNVIGGASAGAANVIAGSGFGSFFAPPQDPFSNIFAGVLVDPSSPGNAIQRNLIASNSGDGIFLDSFGNTAGGGSSAGANVILRNGFNGIGIGSNGTAGNVVQKNMIGVQLDPFGNIVPGDMGNFGNGVSLIEGASHNVIGGLDPVLGNIVAFNHAKGVSVSSGNADSILSDLIFSNGGAGIFLGPGANDNQAAPALSGARFGLTANERPGAPGLTKASSAGSAAAAVTPAAASITISGTLTATPNAAMTLQFFIGTGCSGTGDEFLGSLPVLLGTSNVTTDSTGSAAFSVTLTLPAGAPAVGFVNASATNPNGSTSTFAQCTAINAGCSLTCPPNQTAVATSSSGAVVNYPSPVTGGGCAGASVTSTPPSGSTFPIGMTKVTATVTGSGGETATCSFTVTVTAPGPTIISVERSGKNLLVTGTNFDQSAVIVVDGVNQKTSPGDSPNTLIGKKSFVAIDPGHTATVQVRNGNGAISPGFSFTRPG